jgi:hypothetical protein
MVLRKEANFFTSHYFIFITLQLGLHIKMHGPHTPYSHVNKLKDVAKG